MSGRRLRLLAYALGVTAAALLGWLAPSPAAAEDTTRGRQLFQLCATCHGDRGQGDHRYNAPNIAGLDRWYVERQLTRFKEGGRAYRAEDTTGLQMRPMARSLVTEADVKAVAAYVSGLPRVPAAPTLGGDPGRGQASYAVCLACHGDRAQGNQGTGGAPLAGQADWYLVAQLTKFRQGLRGTSPHDPTGAQMRPMAMTLPNDQAILDVVAYIRTLGTERR